MADLGAWATEEYRVPASGGKPPPPAQPDDQQEN
jgi:endogenous inhibitor of DNA gyrase (YacG/DUF329 family)